MYIYVLFNYGLMQVWNNRGTRVSNQVQIKNLFEF